LSRQAMGGHLFAEEWVLLDISSGRASTCYADADNAAIAKM
jgi:hypothetical protein